MTAELSVLERYTEGAKMRQEALCCPVDYDRELLRLLPQEIIERDYGCGDPSSHVRPGDTVLDLGSGGGKICYMAAQLVGPTGKVIGIDMNDEMLALARKYQPAMAEKLGGERVRFHKGYIQDLALDVAAMEAWLAEHPVRTAADLIRLKSWQSRQKSEHPLIADASIDLVLSNCVLNLVDDGDKRAMFHEIFRVVKPGGRIAISDIVADEAAPAHLRADPELWSGCISGAMTEGEFLQGFIDAGFMGVCIESWGDQPWQVVEGIEFRSVTVTGYKKLGSECIDRGHAVVYRGPHAEVRDEEGHVYPRGQRIAVCERTFRQISEGPWRKDFIALSPARLLEPRPFTCGTGTQRSPQVTKGGVVEQGVPSGKCC